MENDVNQSEYKSITSCPLCSNEDLVTVLQNPSDKILNTKALIAESIYAKNVVMLSFGIRLLPHNQFKAYENYYTHDQRGKAVAGDKFQFFSYMFKKLN